MSALEAQAREFLLLATANRQFGLLRHAHLRAAGLAQHQIEHRLATARLNRVQHRVYALGHTTLRDEGVWLAALWACGQHAVLSHTTAAAFHRMLEWDLTGDVHVSSPARVKSRPGIVAHRTRHLDRADLFHSGPFTVTTIPRTLVDVADILDWPEYRELADRQPRLHLHRIAEAQARTPFRPGAPRVRRLIEADDAHTKSEFERRFLRFLAAHRLPRPDGLNVRVAGHRADCVYRAQRLVIELDGRAFHRRRSQMRADRQRDGDYQLAGYRILRLVWDDLHPSEAAATADRICRLLAAPRTLRP